MEQRQDTCPTWQCLSPVLHVVSSVQRQPPIWWCHQPVAHPSETVRLPWQVHERGTVYRQLSAQPPHRSLPLKKNSNQFCLDCHSVCDNVYCLLTMFSALATVCTVYCAIEIVLITLHYIALDPGGRKRGLGGKVGSVCEEYEDNELKDTDTNRSQFQRWSQGMDGSLSAHTHSTCLWERR